MKKTFPMILALAAMVCSCDKNAGCIDCQNPDEPKDSAVLSVSLAFEDEPSTKAVAAYTTAQDYEKAVNSVQVLVFDANGDINFYKDAGTSVSGISISTTTGAKTVWAVVNGPDLSMISDMDALKATAVDLGDNSVSKSEGFVMAGSASCTVTASGATANVNVSRLVSRVAVQRITNSLPSGYGAMTVNNITLINVVGNQNLDGSADIATWYNRAGRKDGATSASQVIDGSANAASCSALTFASPAVKIENGDYEPASAPYLFYSYPNGTAGDANGWSGTFTARKTRIVVAATINGNVYYYPVTIDTLERNKAYTVELTITGLGSDDPDKPVEKGTVSATVTVQGWESGATYEETI